MSQCKLCGVMNRVYLEDGKTIFCTACGGCYESKRKDDAESLVARKRDLQSVPIAHRAEADKAWLGMF